MEIHNKKEDLFNQVILFRDISRRLSAEFHLTIDEISFLGILFIEKPTYVKKISELLKMSPPKTSKVLLRLESKALIKRSLDSRDHRKEQITLTANGIELFEHILVKISILYSELWLQPQSNKFILKALEHQN